MLEKMLMKKNLKTPEEFWADQEIVQNGWLQDNERILSKLRAEHARTKSASR